MVSISDVVAHFFYAAHLPATNYMPLFSTATLKIFCNAATRSNILLKAVAAELADYSRPKVACWQ